MKRKKRTSTLKSRQQRVEEETYSYLPDDCWEFIFKFIINDDKNKNRQNMNSLSHVSKRFLSITNQLRVSLTIYTPTRPFLPRLLKRFTKLNTLDLTHLCGDLNVLLSQISNFPLKLTSLKLPRRCTFPANGLRVFSQNITTLTSLTCSDFLQCNNDLSLIGDCFPLLKQLNLSHPLMINKTNLINGIYSLLSKCRCIQHLDLNRTCFLNDQHVAELSLFLVDLVSINLSGCHNLTRSALFSLVRNCPSLSEVKMKCTNIGKESVENYDFLVEFGVYPQLKSLYLGKNQWLSDEGIIMFASNFPNLQLLDLNSCNLLSDGICQALRRCGKIRNLNLACCSNVKLVGMNFVVPKLEVLNLSRTMVDDETLNVISKYCCGLLKLLLNNCDNVTEKGVKDVVENCTQLRDLFGGISFK